MMKLQLRKAKRLIERIIEGNFSMVQILTKSVKVMLKVSIEYCDDFIVNIRRN